VYLRPGLDRFRQNFDFWCLGSFRSSATALELLLLFGALDYEVEVTQTPNCSGGGSRVHEREQNFNFDAPV